MSELEYHILLILYVSYEAKGQRERCLNFRYDFDYHVQAKGFLRYHDVPITWEHARKHCQLQKAILAAPINEDIKIALKQLLFRASHLHPEDIFVHTSFNSKYLAGYYVTVGGKRLANIRSDWGAEEPIRTRKFKNDIAFDGTGELFVVDFDDHYPYLCYKNMTRCQFMSSHGITDHDYETAYDGHIYKFHHVPQTWDHAVTTCYGEGGYLAVMNSKREADHIVVWHKTAKPNIYNPSKEDKLMHSGFRRHAETLEYLTLFGQTIEDSGYSDFDYAKAVVSDKYCGALDVEGKLNITHCEGILHPFFCEMENNFQKYKYSRGANFRKD